MGVNTVALELPYHLHRRPRTGPIRDFISSDLDGMIEATRQLRGECGPRQVEGAKLAVAHGSGGLLSSQATTILAS